MREVLEFDFSKLNLRGAITGTIALAIVIVFIGELGTSVIAAGLAALFVVAGGPADTKRPDWNSLLLVVAGGLVTLAVGYSADSVVWATITLTLVTLLATLLALRGKRAATMGVFGVLWAVIALSLGATADTAAELSLAFVVGGAVALFAMLLASFSKSTAMEGIEDNNGAEDEDDVAADRRASPEAVHRARVAIVKFAILRALAVGACIYLGYTWFPEHTAWAALTFVLVVKPPPHQTVVVGVGRMLGTALGVGIGVLIALLAAGNTPVLVAVFVAAAYLMLATGKVNAAISTMWTTVVLIVSQALMAEQATSAGWQRLLATLLGVAFAFLIIVIMNAVAGQRQEKPPIAPVSPPSNASD